MPKPKRNAPEAAPTAKGATGLNTEAPATPKGYHGAAPHRKRAMLRFQCDGGRAFTIHGQNAKALKALIKAGPKGVTANEASSWAYRFSAYCWELRHNYGLAIAMVREPHPGGWHGRYVLQSRVTILLTDA